MYFSCCCGAISQFGINKLHLTICLCKCKNSKNKLLLYEGKKQNQWICTHFKSKKTIYQFQILHLDHVLMPPPVHSSLMQLGSALSPQHLNLGQSLLPAAAASRMLTNVSHWWAGELCFKPNTSNRPAHQKENCLQPHQMCVR